MATPVSPVQPSSSSTPDVQEHTVRLQRERRKKYSIMKIGSGVDLDFNKLQQSQTSVRIERENNFKEFKNAYDIDNMPKFGAGSEFGREEKEMARRKKYGIRIRKYNPEDQPWVLKVGTGKNMKKYKGLREGTVSDNTSYYIFTKSADGAFEAVPVEEWYNYTPQIRYKYLNSEEAEEEFSRRDKTLNIFNIMVKKRLRNDLGDGDDEGAEKLPKGKSKKKDLQLTDMDDWAEISDEDDDDDNEDGEDGDDAKKKPKPGKGKKNAKKRVKNSKHNSDDEAIEESDEGDFDDREVDYITDSGSSSDGGPSGGEEQKEKTDKYAEKGVDEEDGLRKLIDSGEEDEEDEENKEDDEEDKDKDGKKKAGLDSDSSSSSSDSDSDIEKDDKISSALFMQKGSEKKKPERTASPKPDDKGTKRKLDGDGPSVKKARTDSPLTTQGGGSSSDGINEDAIRRYLMRKPMTTKDLFQKFRSKKLNMTNEAMTHVIAQLLKKINPERKTINKVMYLSLKSE